MRSFQRLENRQKRKRKSQSNPEDPKKKKPKEALSPSPNNRKSKEGNRRSRFGKSVKQGSDSPKTSVRRKPPLRPQGVSVTHVEFEIAASPSFTTTVSEEPPKSIIKSPFRYSYFKKVWLLSFQHDQAKISSFEKLTLKKQLLSNYKRESSSSSDSFGSDGLSMNGSSGSVVSSDLNQSYSELRLELTSPKRETDASDHTASQPTLSPVDLRKGEKSTPNASVPNSEAEELKAAPGPSVTGNQKPRLSEGKPLLSSGVVIPPSIEPPPSLLSFKKGAPPPTPQAEPTSHLPDPRNDPSGSQQLPRSHQSSSVVLSAQPHSSQLQAFSPPSLSAPNDAAVDRPRTPDDASLGRRPGSSSRERLRSSGWDQLPAEKPWRRDGLGDRDFPPRNRLISSADNHATEKRELERIRDRRLTERPERPRMLWDERRDRKWGNGKGSSPYRPTSPTDDDMDIDDASTDNILFVNQGKFQPALHRSMPGLLQTPTYPPRSPYPPAGPYNNHMRWRGGGSRARGSTGLGNRGSARQWHPPPRGRPR